MTTQSGHYPVMLPQVLEYLKPRDGGVYVDATFGGGGYTRAILEAADCKVYAFDRDPEAIARGAALKQHFGDRLTLVESPFSGMEKEMARLGEVQLDGVVLDLGVSSFQLDQAERGFSFMRSGPLDMRMSREGKSAADLVATLDEGELADIIFKYGEERHARKIARAIVHDRKVKPFNTTLDLAGLIERITPKGKEKIHPATRTFQALRIAVNDELGEVERGLEAAVNLLKPQGRVVVVTFHSLEDRIAKTVFRKLAGPKRHTNRYKVEAEGDADIAYSEVERKVILPSEAECRQNPRSRSAKMRVLERVK